MTTKSKCGFCLKEIASDNEVKQGLCDNCYQLRRIMRRIQKQKKA